MEFSIAVKTVEYSVTGNGRKGRKPTCINGTLAEDNKACIPAHDGKGTFVFDAIPFMALIINSIVSCELIAASFWYKFSSSLNDGDIMRFLFGLNGLLGKLAWWVFSLRLN